MVNSILQSTKKVLGLSEDYLVFDEDILMHINTSLAVIDQLGIGPAGGFFISDDTEVWADIGLPDNQLNILKTYVFLKVRMLFDPPSTSFHLESMTNHIKEYEWRLNALVETSGG